MRIFKKKQKTETIPQPEITETIEKKIYYKCKGCGHRTNHKNIEEIETEHVICTNYNRLKCSCGSVHFKIFIN